MNCDCTAVAKVSGHSTLARSGQVLADTPNTTGGVTFLLLQGKNEIVIAPFSNNAIYIEYSPQHLLFSSFTYAADIQTGHIC
jgi:hypothetical protein